MFLCHTACECVSKDNKGDFAAWAWQNDLKDVDKTTTSLNSCRFVVFPKVLSGQSYFNRAVLEYELIPKDDMLSFGQNQIVQPVCQLNAQSAVISSHYELALRYLCMVPTTNQSVVEHAPIQHIIQISHSPVKAWWLQISFKYQAIVTKDIARASVLPLPTGK